MRCTTTPGAVRHHSLPWLLGVVLEPRPPGLNEAHHWLRERVVVERSVDAREALGDRTDHVPQGLRRDHEVVAREDAHLPFERDVVEVLVDDGLDRERQRVATARQRARGARRGLDAAAAGADVLRLAHVDDAVADLDDVDHLRGLGLVAHRLQRAATARALPVGVVERARERDVRQVRLRRRPALAAWLRRRLRARVLRGLLGGLGLAGQLLDQRQRLLQLFLVAGVERQLVALALQLADRVLQLRVQRHRHPPQLLDVRLAFE
jgi:hypothetical protein